MEREKRRRKGTAGAEGAPMQCWVPRAMGLENFYAYWCFLVSFVYFWGLRPRIDDKLYTAINLSPYDRMMELLIMK